MFDFSSRHVVFAWAFVFSAAAWGQSSDQARPIRILPPKVVAKTGDTKQWNRLILSATPKIHSGDVDRLSAAMHSAATKCSLTMMATVTRQQSNYILSEIGVGYSVKIEGVQTTISSATAASQGAKLGFIERQVLRGNEQRFAEVKQIAHTSTLAIFDAPAIFSSSSGHQSLVMRHLCWIDPRTGKGALLVWLLGSPTASSGRTVLNYPMRLVVWGTQETRKIHVDGSAFVFGIPSETAFGLEDLPPGADIEWTEAAKRLAGRARFDANEISALANAMNDAIARTKMSPVAPK